MKTNQLFLKICGITEQYNACRASALCTKGALHICRRQMFHTFVCLTRRGVQDTKCFIQSAFTLIELLVNVACKTGVLYNRCGMLSLWGGALKTDKNGQKRTKTDIGAPQNTAGFAQQQNTPLFFESERICLPVQEMQDMWVPSLGQEDPLEEEMATRYNIPAWRIPWMEEPGGLQSMGSQRVGHD